MEKARLDNDYVGGKRMTDFKAERQMSGSSLKKVERDSRYGYPAGECVQQGKVDGQQRHLIRKDVITRKNERKDGSA